LGPTPARAGPVEEFFELTHMCQMAWCCGRPSKDWKTEVISPIHNKGDRSEWANFRCISLLSFPGKVYAKCLEKRCREIIEPQLEDTQCRFRAGHSTADQFSTLQKIFEKSSECGKDFYSCFVDLLKVYHYATKNFLCRGWDVF